MNVDRKTSRILGFAFFLQAVTSLISEAFLLQPLIVPGDMSKSMLQIAAHPALLQANILGQVITAMGIIFLGAVLFAYLRQQNEKIALIALGFYILEAALLAASRLEAFSLLRLSQEYAASGQPASLLLLGKLAYESTSYGLSLHMLPCSVGVILFYYLLDQSRIVPRPLSLWGLISAVPLLIGAPFAVFGYKVPIFFYVPYIPFEFVIGIWILLKGSPDRPRDELAISATQGACP